MESKNEAPKEEIKALSKEEFDKLSKDDKQIHLQNAEKIVENFLKKSSIISFSKRAINDLGESCALLADTEGLTAHAKSVRVRLEEKGE